MELVKANVLQVQSLKATASTSSTLRLVLNVAHVQMLALLAQSLLANPHPYVKGYIVSLYYCFAF